MTLTITTPASGLPVRFEPPVASFPLAHAIRQVDDPHPDVGRPREFRAAVQAEAAAHLRAFQAAATPVTFDHFSAWVRPILLVSRGQMMSREETDAVVAILYRAFQAYPAAAFTEDLQAEAIRTLDYRPGGAALARLLDPAMAVIRDGVRTLEYIVSARTEADVVVTAPIPAPLDGRTAVDIIQPPMRSVAQQIAELGE